MRSWQELVSSPAWPPLWYFCSWRLLVASKNPLLSNPLHHIIFLSPKVQIPRPALPHICTNSHAHTYAWPLTPLQNQFRDAFRLGEDAFSPRLLHRQCLGHFPLSVDGMGEKQCPGLGPRGPEHSDSRNPEGSCPLVAQPYQSGPTPAHPEGLCPKAPNPEDKRVSGKPRGATLCCGRSSGGGLGTKELGIPA